MAEGFEIVEGDGGLGGRNAVGVERANAGDIVATLVTDENGEAETEPLYLGTYTVYEAKAKDGFALNVDEVTVELSYQGQEIEVI